MWRWLSAFIGTAAGERRGCSRRQASTRQSRRQRASPSPAAGSIRRAEPIPGRSHFDRAAGNFDDNRRLRGNLTVDADLLARLGVQGHLPAAPFGDSLFPPAKLEQDRKPAPAEMEQAFPSARLNAHFAAVEFLVFDQLAPAVVAAV